MKIFCVKLIIFRAGLNTKKFTEGGKLEKNNSYRKKTVGMKSKLNTTVTILFLVENFSAIIPLKKLFVIPFNHARRSFSNERIHVFLNCGILPCN